MPMRRVCAATWADVRLNLIVVGLLSARSWRAGKLPVEVLPTVKVTGPQLALRTSCGCIWEMLLPLRNSFGVPSHVPIFQIVVGCERVEAIFFVTLPPLVTATELVATTSSP